MFGEADHEDEALSLEERADRYVDRLEELYGHAAVYVIVNAGLVGLNLLTSPDRFWALWPLLGWGIHLAGHAVAVVGVPGRADWRRRTRAAFLRQHENEAGREGQGAAAHTDRASDAEQARLRRRIEHLETIVTSADWELVLDSTPEGSTAQAQAATLADEVVQG